MFRVFLCLHVGVCGNFAVCLFRESAAPDTQPRVVVVVPRVAPSSRRPCCLTTGASCSPWRPSAGAPRPWFSCSRPTSRARSASCRSSWACSSAWSIPRLAAVWVQWRSLCQTWSLRTSGTARRYSAGRAGCCPAMPTYSPSCAKRQQHHQRQPGSLAKHPSSHSPGPKLYAGARTPTPRAYSQPGRRASRRCRGSSALLAAARRRALARTPTLTPTLTLALAPTLTQSPSPEPRARAHTHAQARGRPRPGALYCALCRRVRRR